MEQRRQSLMTWSLAWLNFPYCTLTTLTVLKWFVDKEWIHTLSPWDRYILECAQTDKKTHCDTYSIEDKDCGSSGHANLREACYDSSNLSLSTNEEDKTLASSHFNSLAELGRMGARGNHGELLPLPVCLLKFFFNVLWLSYELP